MRMLMGMGERIGSIDAGKDADFLIMEGHPFDYRVLPQMVFIDGKLVFREEGKQLSRDHGGAAAGEARR